MLNLNVAKLFEHWLTGWRFRMPSCQIQPASLIQVAILSEIFIFHTAGRELHVYTTTSDTPARTHPSYCSFAIPPSHIYLCACDIVPVETRHSNRALVVIAKLHSPQSNNSTEENRQHHGYQYGGRR